MLLLREIEMINNNELRWCGVDVEKRRMIGIGAIENLEVLDSLENLDSLDPTLPLPPKKKEKIFHPPTPPLFTGGLRVFSTVKKIKQTA